MKEFIIVKCGKWCAYRRDTIKKVELDDDAVRVMWSNDNDGNVVADTYYPNNEKQFFKKLLKDLGADEESKKTKEI